MVVSPQNLQNVLQFQTIDFLSAAVHVTLVEFDIGMHA